MRSSLSISVWNKDSQDVIRRPLMDENKLTELLSRVDILEVKLAEANERISKLERCPRHVTAESNRPTQNRLNGFKPDEIKEFHGALFHRKHGRYENTVFCETCKVPLENLGNNHLFKCPVCRKNVEFTPNELPDFIKALNSGKAG